MKTPDEIKDGMECLARGKFPNAYCDDCSYHEKKANNLHVCTSLEIARNAIVYIRQLECERDALLADLREADLVDCVHCIHAEKPIAANECDDTDGNCEVCEKACACKTCRNNSNWIWRGARQT